VADLVSHDEAQVLPFANLTDDAKRAYELIGGELRRLNFVRASDESLLVRYCKSLAQFWTATAKLDALGSETYECQMTGGGTMQRIHPLFIVQQHLAKRLEAMEDRLGLSPQARQQYLLRMAATGAQGSLPLPAPAKQDPAAAPRPAAVHSPVGMLSRHVVN
jgi:P27 family predicted phage terminase small subunit